MLERVVGTYGVEKIPVPVILLNRSQAIWPEAAGCAAYCNNESCNRLFNRYLLPCQQKFYYRRRLKLKFSNGLVPKKRCM